MSEYKDFEGDTLEELPNDSFQNPIDETKNIADDNANNPSWLNETPIASSKNQATKSKDGKSMIKYKRPLNQIKSNIESEDEIGICCPTDPVLFWFQIFHFLSGLSCLFSLGINFYVIFNSLTTWKYFIIRCYAIIFSLLLLSIELDIKYIILRIKLLKLWVFRGLIYIFLGVITTGEDESIHLKLPENIIGLITLIIGIFYLIMGIFCLEDAQNRRLQQMNIQKTLYTELVDDFSISPTKV